MHFRACERASIDIYNGRNFNENSNHFHDAREKKRDCAELATKYQRTIYTEKIAIRKYTLVHGIGMAFLNVMKTKLLNDHKMFTH